MRTKSRLVLWTIGLVAVLSASACAPAATRQPVASEPVQAQILLPTPPPNTSPPGALTLADTPTPIATSRGPNLEATDPTTVSLASGEVQLVEFFRFT